MERRHDVQSALEWATARLRQAGVDQPRRDVRVLLTGTTGLDPAQVIGHPERALHPTQQAAFEQAIERRALREPVSRILGWREFWSLRFALSPDTLDPRPDSETLVEAVLGAIGDRSSPLEILDLGSGTGCLLLALLSELPRSRGLGIDISPAAVAVAARNAEALGLARRARFQLGDWAAGVTGAWQLIVSNPPYIIEKTIAGLAPEVARYDPPLALSGGVDGLAAYRELIPQAARLLAPDGTLALEIGEGQADQVAQLVHAAGLTCQARVRDLATLDRCILATRQKMTATRRI